MRKVGILGGSFDPVHNGHIGVAQDAALQMGLDMVYFMPVAYSPLRDHGPYAADYCRYAMIELAIKGCSRFGVLDWELEAKGISYSINTARKLRKNWPEMSFYWIIGEDLVASLPWWREIDELVRLVEFVGVRRPGVGNVVPQVKGLKLHMINNPGIEVSSTEVRRRVREGESIDELVPEGVRNYILVNGLYRG